MVGTNQYLGRQLQTGRQSPNHQYFEFGGATGEEQLVITLRDPRAFGSAASGKPVTRKDENNGSNFMQELQPGTFPVIAQALKIRHGAGE